MRITDEAKRSWLFANCRLACVSGVVWDFERWLVVFNKKEKKEGVCWIFINLKSPILSVSGTSKKKMKNYLLNNPFNFAKPALATLEAAAPVAFAPFLTCFLASCAVYATTTFAHAFAFVLEIFAIMVFLKIYNANIRKFFLPFTNLKNLQSAVAFSFLLNTMTANVLRLNEVADLYLET